MDKVDESWFNKLENVNYLVLRWKRDKVEWGKSVEKVEDLGGYWKRECQKEQSWHLIE